MNEHQRYLLPAMASTTPDGNALVVEDGALLDVELEVGIEVRPAGLRGLEDAVDRESRPLEDLGAGGVRTGSCPSPDLLLVEELP